MNRRFHKPADHDTELQSRFVATARYRKRWSALVLGTLIVAAGVCSNLCGQQPNATREYKVKVAYIYNLTRYVTWPTSAFTDAQSPFVIAVLGHDPLSQSLDSLQARKAGGRRIVIRRFDSVADYQHSHILFVSRDSTSELRRELLRRTEGTPVLIAGESPDFATDGAGLNFFNDRDGTVGFELNVDAVRRGSMRIDAKLLSIARLVRDRGAPQF